MSSDFKELLLEEMAIRSLSTNTKRAYIRSMKGLCNYFKRTADQITVKDIRAYILYMLKEKQLAPRTINREIAAYRFFFTHVMGGSGVQMHCQNRRLLVMFQLFYRKPKWPQ
jgi:site-specific recombinase XerD